MAVDDQYTKLLLHMDGADNGTTFTDEAGKSITRGGNVCTKTGSKKFGTASAYFDGNGDYLRFADSDDWYFGTGNFTIDLCFSLSVWPYSGNYYTFCNQYVSETGQVNFRLMNISNIANINLKVNSTNVITVSFGGVNLNEWHHLALVRSDNNFMIFLDGTQIGSTVVSSISLDNLAAALQIGCLLTQYGQFNGYIDEFRISKGIARWTSNFTPPTEQYAALKALVGTIDSQSSVLGSLTIESSSGISLAGDISSQSGLTGILTVSKSLSGIIGGASGITGVLSKSVNLVGAVASVSSITAALTNGEHINLAGLIEAQSSVSGTLTIEKSLQGEIAASSSMVASISVYKALAGQVRGSTEMSASLTKRVGLAGAIMSQSNIIADLLVLVPAPVYVSGAISGTSAISANLTVVCPDIELEGDFITEITLAGDFVTGVTLAGEFITGITLEGGFKMAKKAQDFEMYAGEDKVITIPVADVGTIVSASWKLCEKVKYTDLITKDSTVPADLTIAGDSLVITLVPDDTEELDGNYYHEARVTDSVGRTETVAVGTGTIYRTAHDPE